MSVSPCGRRSVSIHRFATKPADIYQKGSGLLARQRSRLDCSGQLRSQSKFAGRSCHHGTANSASLHPGPSSPRALSTRQTTHKHHPFTAPIQYPYTQHKHAPAPRSQLALPNASTDQPLYAHRDSINIQSTAPSQLFRKLRHRCTASPAVPPSACDLQHPALLFPSRAAFALARASPTAAHWDMYRRTPTTQTTLLG